MKNLTLGDMRHAVVALIIISVATVSSGISAAEENVPVTVDNFVRAETDTYIKIGYEVTGGWGKWLHHRAPAPLDEQDVIRMNRDTIYSSTVLDLSKPVFVTVPESDGRYMSVHVINQDHYCFVIPGAGRHELTQKEVGSRYAFIIVRTFVDPDNPADVKKANALQDQLRLEGGGDGALDLPHWNMEQLSTARGALNTLAGLGMNFARAFGKKNEVDPIDHLIGAAAGWGGLPQAEAFYVFVTVPNNDGTPYAVTVKDTPVDAFWSITVYNADGFIEENSLGHYSFNNITAKPNADGSTTIHFGGCGDGRENCLPISDGWNYAVRMYQPHKQILDGSWKFPEPELVK